MSSHVIFDKAKVLLKKHFENRIVEHEEGTYLSIDDKDFFISSDDNELTIGYGLPHKHYDPRYDSLAEAVELLHKLLAKRIRITDYFKGSFSYKYKVEIELNETEFEEFGTAATWLFPYWKKTTTRERLLDRLIDPNEIVADIEEMKNDAQQNLKSTKVWH